VNVKISKEGRSETNKMGTGIEAGGRANRVTERDGQLMGMVALARYLSMEQLRRLFFPAATEKVARKRLARLAGEWDAKSGSAYIRRVQYRVWDGSWVLAWGLTADGYGVAAKVLRALPPVPRRDTASAVMPHAIGTSELLVRLAPRGADGVARVPDAFTWSNGDADPIRFGEPFKKGAVQDRRVLQPDAVLTIPKLQRRLFIEYETGAHPINGRADRAGATVNKLARYSRFLTEMAWGDQRTHYARCLPDGLPAEVVVVVTSQVRRENVTAAIAATRRREPGKAIVARAVTLDQLAAELAPAVGAQVPAVPKPLAPAGARGRPTYAATAEEELLRPGRVAVRGEYLLKLDQTFRHLAQAAEEARKALASANLAAPPLPVSLGFVRAALEVYASRGRAALEAHGLREAK
jgi:hypothetical protein